MAKKTAKKSAARKPNAAFMKPMTPSAALSEVVGSKPIPRTEVTKKLWLYIKKNKLQDQKNKRMIKADDALKTVFGGKATVNMFEMTKLVNKHLAK
jgi:upstream activation factor subunit UAF30